MTGVNSTTASNNTLTQNSTTKKYDENSKKITELTSFDEEQGSLISEKCSRKYDMNCINHNNGTLECLQSPSYSCDDKSRNEYEFHTKCSPTNNTFPTCTISLDPEETNNLHLTSLSMDCGTANEGFGCDITAGFDPMRGYDGQGMRIKKDNLVSCEKNNRTSDGFTCFVQPSKSTFVSKYVGKWRANCLDYNDKTGRFCSLNTGDKQQGSVKLTHAAFQCEQSPKNEIECDGKIIVRGPNYGCENNTIPNLVERTPGATDPHTIVLACIMSLIIIAVVVFGLFWYKKKRGLKCSLPLRRDTRRQESVSVPTSDL